LPANPDTTRPAADQQEAKAAILAGKPLRTQVHDDYLDAQVYRVYVPIQAGQTSNPWSFVITVPIDRVLAGVAQTRDIALLLGVLSITAMVLLMRQVISRLVVAPLGGEPSYAAAIARRIAEGDLSQDVLLLDGDHTSLLASMRDMQIHLRELLGHVRTGSEQVAGGSQELSATSEQISATTVSLARVAEGLSVVAARFKV